MIRTVQDAIQVVTALTPLVVHSRKVQQDIAALQALQEDPASAELVANVLAVVPLTTLAKLKAAVDGFLAEVEPKAELVKTLGLK